MKDDPEAPFDRGLAAAKRLLWLSAADAGGRGEWREGYDAALKQLLSDYGIDATYVPATYLFSDDVKP